MTVQDREKKYHDVHAIERALEDWWFDFDERAAIAEYEGGLERSEAEYQALKLLRWHMDCPVDVIRKIQREL